MLLAIDEEGGDVTRLEWRTGSSYPGGAALGVVDDAGADRGRRRRRSRPSSAAVGVNWNLAPVADVNVPENPVIGARAFGDDAALVARHVAAFVRGHAGRGGRRVREALPRPRRHHAGFASRAARRSTGDVEAGLEPFRAAIAAGVRSIMTAHVRVPALDDAPATLNRRDLQDLLRDELGFDGVIDRRRARHAGRAARRVGVEDVAVAALERRRRRAVIGPTSTRTTSAAVCAALVARVSRGSPGGGGRPHARARGLGSTRQPAAPTAPSASTRRGAR